jgi:adenylate kinase
MSRRILFLGPQGSGKGTQAVKLSVLLGVPHISTGDMLRQAVADGTELGRRAGTIMAAGDLVPDDLVVAMVAERLGADDARCGFLLDGFPRTGAQARALDDALPAGADGEGGAVDVVVLLEVDHDELMRRLLQRAADQGRADDTAESIERRLSIYWEETAPLAEYYPTHGVDVARIDGMGSVDEVFSRIARSLSEAPS